MAIAMAIASLAFAAVNDVLFRLYARRGRPIGIYLAIVGAIWTICFSVAAGPEQLLNPDGASIGWGLISGAFCAAANVLLVQAMARHEAGVCSTIYRLNLAPAALVAFLLFGEPLTMWSVGGIALAVGAIVLFFSSSGRGAFQIRLSLLLVVLASLLRAAMGISYKWALLQGASMQIILVINGLVWMASGLAYGMFREKSRPFLRHATFGYGLGSGILVCGIVFFMMSALKLGHASVVLPISQLSFVLTAVIGAGFLGEALTRRKVVALLMALLCVILLAIGDTEERGKRLGADRVADPAGAQISRADVGRIGATDRPFQGAVVKDRKLSDHPFAAGAYKNRAKPE